MKVVSFVTQKGGSGKTTLAISCAVAAEQAGKRVLICDLDPQRSAESWYQDREADTPKLVSLSSGQLEEAIATAKSQGFDLVLIDTPGRDEPAVAAAIRLSDFCIIPCRPTPADMKATPETVHTIRRLERPAVFVLTQTPPRSYRIGEAEQGLSILGMVAPIHIVMRNAYQDAQGAGQGVTEYEPDGKATQEIRALWAWIDKKMEKITYDPT
ncbi:MAG TPA: ParA family protein [Dehalococcoidia bacterium]|nr:ParA family protein [Dehalococcoidia bacterium]